MDSINKGEQPVTNISNSIETSLNMCKVQRMALQTRLMMGDQQEVVQRKMMLSPMPPELEKQTGVTEAADIWNWIEGSIPSQSLDDPKLRSAIMAIIQELVDTRQALATVASEKALEKHPQQNFQELPSVSPRRTIGVSRINNVKHPPPVSTPENSELHHNRQSSHPSSVSKQQQQHQHHNIIKEETPRTVLTYDSLDDNSSKANHEARLTSLATQLQKLHRIQQVVDSRKNSTAVSDLVSIPLPITNRERGDSIISAATTATTATTTTSISKKSSVISSRRSSVRKDGGTG